MRTISLSLPGVETSEFYTVFFSQEEKGVAYFTQGCKTASESATVLAFDYLQGITLYEKDLQIPDYYYSSIACDPIDNIVVISQDSTKTPSNYPFVLPTLLILFILIYTILKDLVNSLI